ncbi:MAG: sensor histidine kinase [Cyanobacteria bacterium P01_A01_bin.45]
MAQKDILNPVLFFPAVIIFGAMGLRLPRSKIIYKIIYTLINIILMLLVNYAAGRKLGFSPPLLLILAIRSCLIFKTQGRLVVAFLSWILFIFTLNTNVTFNLPLTSTLVSPKDIESVVANLQMTAGFFFSFILIFVFLLVNSLISERESRQKLVLAHEQLRQYALRIEDQATLQERNRIAREIHDSIGHSLTAQSIQISNALLFIDSNINKAKSFLVQAKELGSDALKEVRFSVTALRSDPLKGKSLKLRIENLFTEFQSRSQIQPKLSLQVNETLSTEINLAIYRIIQEALTNISKHSNADEVMIEIKIIDNSLCLYIEDNGVGFHPNQNTTGFGLQSMRDRTSALGGHFYINSQPKEGCSITAFFPISRFE